MKFYRSFGVDHPFSHYTQPIIADTEEIARKLMFSVYETRWAFIYEESKLKDLRRWTCGDLPLLSQSLHYNEERDHGKA